MKKIIVLLMMCLMLSQTAFAGSYPTGKLVLGFALGIVGTLAAVDGYSQVKENISSPALEQSNFSWSKHPEVWWVDASGTVSNKGNVPLETVTVSIKYYDSANTFLGESTVEHDNLAMDSNYTWTNSYITPTRGEPASATTSASYTFSPIYRTHTKNVAQGIAGVACAVTGIYLVVSSIINMNQMSDYLSRHDLDLRLARRDDSVGLRLSKRI